MCQTAYLQIWAKAGAIGSSEVETGSCRLKIDGPENTGLDSVDRNDGDDTRWWRSSGLNPLPEVTEVPIPENAENGPPMEKSLGKCRLISFDSSLKNSSFFSESFSSVFIVGCQFYYV